MSLKRRIERLERQFFEPSKNTLTMDELESLYRIHKKYGQNLDALPGLARAEYQRLLDIYVRHVKPYTP